MNTVKQTNALLDGLVECDSGFRGMKWVRDIANQYMDGIITFGEMLDKVVMDDDNCTQGAKFDLLLSLGFSLEETKRLLMG